MKVSNVFRIYPVFALLVGFLSCGRNPASSIEEHCGKRDKIETVELISIEEKLPEIHSNSGVFMLGDTLIINDYKSTNKRFVVYDIKEDKFLGKFGKFGEGPGEIANFAGIVIDPVNHILYGMGYSTWYMSGFDIREALSDPDYKAFFKTRLENIDGVSPFVATGDWLNDSTAYYEVVVPNEDWTEFDNRIGRVNLNDGSISLIEDNGFGNNTENTLTISLKNRLMVSVGRVHDTIRLFDLEGNLKKIIYGPDYTEKRHRPRFEYFCQACIGKDEIYASYLNEYILEKNFAEDIVVMDLDGKYKKTLHVGKPICGMEYNENFNRLYLSTNDYPQFGYIQL